MFSAQKKSYHYPTLFCTILLVLTIFSSKKALAQEIEVPRAPIFNVATTLDIEEKDVVNGDILSLSEENNELTLSKIAYDEKIYGVASSNPMMVFRTRDSLPVVRSGEALVNITTLNGPVEIGDYITSSALPGKGQKATNMSGFVVGTALEKFTEEDGTPFDHEGVKIYTGKMKISVGIGPASPVQVETAAGGIFGTFKFLVTSLIVNLQTSEEASKIIRYILAALIALATVIVNFLTFGKNVTKGIESIGRNPLAKISIQSMIVLNVVLIAIVSIGGIVLSLVIISL